MNSIETVNQCIQMQLILVFIIANTRLQGQYGFGGELTIQGYSTEKPEFFIYFLVFQIHLFFYGFQYYFSYITISSSVCRPISLFVV